MYKKEPSIQVSIIIPVYNAEKYLKRCLNTVANQTNNNIEIIIINDGSTDSSKKIIEEYMTKYETIRFYNKTKQGVATSRNDGINLSKGEYILFVDADDYIDKDACKELYKIANENRLDILRFNYYDQRHNKIRFKKYSENGQIFSGKEYLKKYIKKKQFLVSLCNTLYKRQFLINSKLKFKDGIENEDERYVPEIVLKANSVMQIDKVYYYYLNNPNSITNKKDRTKDSINSIENCIYLEKIFNNVDDQELKKELMDFLVQKYLQAFSNGRLYRKQYKKIYINKKFLINKSYTFKNKMKTLLFCINSKLYYFINYVKRKMQRIL